MLICRDFTGATGLEPATSGVTGRYRTAGYNRLRPGIAGQSRPFLAGRTGCDRLQAAAARHSLCGTCVVDVVPTRQRWHVRLRERSHRPRPATRPQARTTVSEHARDRATHRAARTWSSLRWSASAARERAASYGASTICQSLYADCSRAAASSAFPVASSSCPARATRSRRAPASRRAQRSQKFRMRELAVESWSFGSQPASQRRR
jgi:hypothetical protein